MPGERSQRTEARRRKNGIPIPAKLWTELEKIGKRHNVRMPEVLAAPV
jgi:LDH2 family malate/lactate/ureidoglycolate dehydrogenase